MVVPMSVISGALWISLGLRNHDGKALNTIILLVCFDVVAVLFPFHWGGENWDED